MRILSIIAQKPSSTGSGVYLSELVRCFKEMGHEQEIICAVYEGDVVGANINATHTVRDDGVGANATHTVRDDGVGANACVARSMGELHEPHYNKIIFNTKDLPIKIAGMSDVMPYESMRYSELASDEKKLLLWMGVFGKKVRKVVERFKPDLIICHHLYLLTAMVIDIVAHIVRDDNVGENAAHIVRGDGVGAKLGEPAPVGTNTCGALVRKDIKRPIIYGICHNTDLRQYQQTDLKRDFIKENIKKLDKAFFLSQENADKGIELFGLDEKNVELIGIGYNNNIFKNERFAAHIVCSDDVGAKLGEPTPVGANGVGALVVEKMIVPTHRLLYVGKVSNKKGVLSLVKAINILDDENIELDIVGGAGNKDEYDEIVRESKKTKSKINFLPPMTQDKLAIEYNNHDIFILPSFFEGMPLVPLEAMACGCKVVISDLPGVKNFYSANVKNASIKYVELPKLTNVDETSDEELDAFEKRLASAIRESIDDKNNYKPDLSNTSWESIARKIIE